jgi:hypothetical protein
VSMSQIGVAATATEEVDMMILFYRITISF